MNEIFKMFLFTLGFYVLVSHSKIVRAVPPDYCLYPLNKTDCKARPTLVFSYYKPGSRCELETWRGCPTYNKFDDQYQCSNTCIYKYSVDSDENKIIDYGKHTKLHLKDDFEKGWRDEIYSLPSKEKLIFNELLDGVINEIVTVPHTADTTSTERIHNEVTTIKTESPISSTIKNLQKNKLVEDMTTIQSTTKEITEPTTDTITNINSTTESVLTTNNDQEDTVTTTLKSIVTTDKPTKEPQITIQPTTHNITTTEPTTESTITTLTVVTTDKKTTTQEITKQPTSSKITSTEPITESTVENIITTTTETPSTVDPDEDIRRPDIKSTTKIITSTPVESTTTYAATTASTTEATTKVSTTKLTTTTGDPDEVIVGRQLN